MKKQLSELRGFFKGKERKSLEGKIEMLEDLIVAATNEALRQLEEDSAKSMEALTGGLNLGGGFPF